jgi:hypothetical protein
VADQSELPFGKFITPSRLKAEFLWRLAAMNIGANTLFPGTDGIGHSIAERFRLGTVERPGDIYDLISIDGKNERIGTVAIVVKDSVVESASRCTIKLRDRVEEGADSSGLSGWLRETPLEGVVKDAAPMPLRTHECNPPQVTTQTPPSDATDLVRAEPQQETQPPVTHERVRTRRRSTKKGRSQRKDETG